MSYASRLQAEQELERIGNFPGRKKLPSWLADKMADDKFYGGYKTKASFKKKARNPICPNCNVAKSSNGTCYC